MPRKGHLAPPAYFRAEAVREAPKRVDREAGEAGVIHGYAVITRGEALGHGVWADATFLGQVAEALGAQARGLKSRFTHPGLCSDGMGKYLGRSRGAWVDGDTVRSDLFISPAAAKSPDGNLAEYVLTLAEDDPEAFGASIVFTRDRGAEEEFALANGEEHEDENGDTRRRFKSPDPDNEHNLPHVRLASLRASDVVDEPAANPGGFFSDGEELAWRAEEALSFFLGLTDQPPPAAAIGLHPDRAKAFFEGFLQRHQLTVSKERAARAEGKTMSDEKESKPRVASLAELKSKYGARPEFVLQQLEANATIDQAEVAFLRLELAEQKAAAEKLQAEREQAEAEYREQLKKAGEEAAAAARAELRGHEGITLPEKALKTAEADDFGFDVEPDYSEAWSKLPRDKKRLFALGKSTKHTNPKDRAKATFDAYKAAEEAGLVSILENQRSS